MKPFRLTRREYLGLGTVGLVVGLVSGLKEILEPFTPNSLAALLVAVGCGLVVVVVVLVGVLWRFRSDGRTLAVPLALLVFLLGATMVSGIALGTYIRAPSTPVAGDGSSGTTTTPTTATSSATTGSSTTSSTVPVSSSTAPPPPPPPAFDIRVNGTIPRCSNIEGVGSRPPEGAAVILVRYKGQDPIFYEQPIEFQPDGITWTARGTQASTC